MRILNDLHSVAVPSQLCAILPIFETNDETDISVTKNGRRYAILLALVLVISSSYFCGDVLFSARYYKILKSLQGDTEEINQTIETIFCIISYTIIVVSCVYNAKKHCRTFTDFAQIDGYLEANGYTGVYSSPKLEVLLIVLSLVVFCIAFFYIHFRSEIPLEKECILLTAYALQMLLSSAFALYLRVVLKNIARRIEFINQRLDRLAHDDGCKENWCELRNLIEIFCKFRYITENMNSVTGVALLFYMGYAFYTVTNQSYLAISTLTTRVEFIQKFDTMGLSVAWVLAEVIIMCIICSSCDDMCSEANTTSQILARVYGKSKEYQNIIDKFLTKSIKQEVQFTAYGFFVIDNSTLFKIFSAVTTYLVILIQFKQLEDSKLEDQQNAKIET